MDSDLADTLTDALTAFDIPQPCVVTRQEESGPEYAPVLTDVDYDCKGWVDNYSQLDHVDSAVQVNDRKVYVLCASLAITPTTADRVTIGGVTYGIEDVQRDPAGAAWIVQARA